MSHTDTNRLRQLEAVALFATVLAVGLTALLEPATAAVESNPVAAGLLDAVGWAGAGVVAIVGEAALFAGWRRLSARGYPRAALGAGAGIVAVGVADVIVNLSVLWRVGLPETARIGEYGGVAAVVAVVALLAYFRGEVRVAVEIVAYAFRGVTSRLSKPDMSPARSVLLVAMLVLASISGAVTFGPLPATDRASAAGTVFEDFEDGTGAFTSGYTIETVTSEKWEGDASLRIQDGEDATASNVGAASTSEIGLAIKAPGGGAPEAQVLLKGSGGSEIAYLEFNNGNLEEGLNSYFSGSVNNSEWLRIRLYNIDYSSETYDIEVTDKDGDVQLSETGISFSKSGISDFDEYSVNNANGANTFYIDYATYGGAGSGLGQTVDGNLTDSDGNAIADGTIELRQNGSVVDSTTTNNSGGWSISQVSDGDYTIRASASGYQNASKDITVSGSPVTVDLTLYEENSYEQVLVLSDETGKFDPDDSSVITFRYTGDSVPTSGPFYDESSWTWVETSSFNWKNTTSQRLKNGEIYAFAVTDGSTRRFNPAGTLYEFVGFYGGSENPKYLRIRDQSETNEVVAADTDDGVTVTYEGNETNTSLDDVEYSFDDGSGGTTYTGGADFDDPSGDYQSTVSNDLLENITDDESTSVPEVDYNGSTSGGEILNGTTDVLPSFPGFTSSGNESSVGGFGPTGGGGGASTGQQIGGLAIIAGAGYFAYRRFGNGNLPDNIPGLGGS